MTDHRTWGVRCTHVVPAISVEAAGPSYSVVRLCESLLGNGAAVSLAALDWSPMVSPPPFLHTFRVGAGPRRLGNSPAMKHWLMSEACSGNIDLLHNHSLWMMPNIYTGMVAKKCNLPLIVSPRGTLSHWAMKSGSAAKRIFWPLVQKRTIRDAALFHATANHELEDIRRAGFRQPVAVIPNGIDIPALCPRKSSKIRTLLFLGRIHPVKGLDILLRAWQIVEGQFPAWQLMVAGPDHRGYLADIQQLARTLGLSRVNFVGPKSSPEKWRIYSDAELFVLPSHSENFGVAVAEALASGTPAIVAKGAPWSGLNAHQAGWWIDHGVDSLVACLGDALSRSPETLREMGNRGRNWMQSDFSWSQIGRQMLITYGWVLKGGEMPPWIRAD